jgi:hypothetical protein
MFGVTGAPKQNAIVGRLAFDWRKRLNVARYGHEIFGGRLLNIADYIDHNSAHLVRSFRAKFVAYETRLYLDQIYSRRQRDNIYWETSARASDEPHRRRW